MRKKESEWKRQLPGGGPDFEVRTDLAVEEGSASREMAERFPVFHCENGGKAIRISV